MQDNVPPSRTPRPAHPAELAADRLIDTFACYAEHFDTEERAAFRTVRLALWRVAKEDR